MSESTDTDATDDGDPTLASFVSRGVSRDLTGIVLGVAGAYGSLVLPGRLWMVSAAVNGIGAILVFTSDATNSMNSAGYFFILFSWSLLALGGMTTRIEIPILITVFWFGFETEMKIMEERFDS